MWKKFSKDLVSSRARALTNQNRCRHDATVGFWRPPLTPGTDPFLVKSRRPLKGWGGGGAGETTEGERPLMGKQLSGKAAVYQLKGSVSPFYQWAQLYQCIPVAELLWFNCHQTKYFSPVTAETTVCPLLRVVSLWSMKTPTYTAEANIRNTQMRVSEKRCCIPKGATPNSPYF